MANPWFESVAEAQRRAKKRLPPSVYSALLAGSEKGVTLDDNLAAFSQLEQKISIAASQIQDGDILSHRIEDFFYAGL